MQKIYKIRVITIPALTKGGIFPNFEIICKGHVFYNWRKQEKQPIKLIRGHSYYDFFIRSAEVLVYDDVRLQFYNDKKLAFHCWFNTYFVDRSGIFYINRNMIDNAHKDKNGVHYDKNFSIKIFMTKMDGQITYKNVECKFFNPKKKKRKDQKKQQALTSDEEDAELEVSDESDEENHENVKQMFSDTQSKTT